MKALIVMAAAVWLAAGPVWAHSDAPAQPKDLSLQLAVPQAAAQTLDAHTQQDIARHHSMAQAHAQAAQCLASGKPDSECQKQLQASCKGLALGKNCGMRHSH